MKNRLSLLCVILCAFFAYAANYGEIPAASDLVSLWHLNGNATDDAGSNNGTVNGPSSINAVYGQGYLWSGTDDITVSADATITDFWDGGGTFACWFHVTDATSSGRFYQKSSDHLLISDNESGSNFDITLRRDRSIVNGRWYITTTLDIWHFLVITYDSSGVGDPTFYIDGEEQQETEETTPNGTLLSDSASDLVIGNRETSDRGLEGSLDEIAIWDRALSASEVKKLYAMQKGMYGIVD